MMAAAGGDDRQGYTLPLPACPPSAMVGQRAGGRVGGEKKKKIENIKIGKLKNGR
jgi:hypothetical protein